jgi:hypothetical protein
MDFTVIFLLCFLVVLIVAIIMALVRYAVNKSGQTQTRTYGSLSFTSRGETVRSIGEKTIADFLTRNNIRYIYEHQATGAWGYGRHHGYKTTLPDFYLPDHRVYVEYWGLVEVNDAMTRAAYVSNMRKKMAMYHSNNIKFISIYPQNLNNLDWIFRAKFKRVSGYELPRS